MQINIFDSGLIGRTGHHFDFCHAIASRLDRKGHGVRIWGAEGANSDLSDEFKKINCAFSGLFSPFAHAPAGIVQNSFDHLEVFARTGASELARAAKADMCLFPTLMPLEFLAYSISERPAPMLGIVHVEPNFQHPHAGRIWAMASDCAGRRNLHVTLGVVDPIIGDFLKTYGGCAPIVETPIPIDGQPKPHRADRLRTVGFFGHQREERGLAMIPAIVDRLLASGYKVVVHDTRGRINSTFANPNLRVLTSFVNDLNHEIANCDLVICLMQWEKYIHRISGIVCHAVANGIPFVLPASTLSAMRFAHLGSSVCYQENSVDGVMEAIEKVGSEYPKFARGAQHGATLWSEKHGAEKFADVIEQRFQLG